jgi:carboxylesterase type B
VSTRFPLETLLSVAVEYEYSQNAIGVAVFVPSSPDPLIPAAPPDMLASGLFRHDTNIIISWNGNDGSFFAPANITTNLQLETAIEETYPGFSAGNYTTVLNLYPQGTYTAFAKTYNISRSI